MHILRAEPCVRKRRNQIRWQDMNERREERSLQRGKDEKGNQIEGTGTDETKPHYSDLGKPASFECTCCMCTQGPDRFH